MSNSPESAPNAVEQTLTDFLLARIAEDEASAERGGSHNGGETFANDNYGCLLIQPARVLAECEAKRRIVERCAQELVGPAESVSAYDIEAYTDGLARDVLEDLASAHADHPDFREEWRP